MDVQEKRSEVPSNWHEKNSTVSLTVGANNLEINGGTDELIFGVVKAWLDAVTGDDKTQASIDRAAEALKAHNDKLAGVVDANTPPPA